jgi:hypothetical protein
MTVRSRVTIHLHLKHTAIGNVHQRSPKRGSYTSLLWLALSACTEAVSSVATVRVYLTNRDLVVAYVAS